MKTKYVNVIARGFKHAFDVSLSKHGKLGITDVQAHKDFILEELEKEDFEVRRTIGTGTPRICDGPSSDAHLFEPTSLCFDLIPVLFSALVATLMVALNYIAKSILHVCLCPKFDKYTMR